MMNFLKVLSLTLLSISTFAQSFNFSKITESISITPEFFNDFDNDGINDILAFQNNEIILFKGSKSEDINSRYKRSISLEIPPPIWFFELLNFEIGDFDGDGDLDIIYQEWGPNLFLIRNDQTKFTIKNLGALEYEDQNIWSGDYNDDGKSDIYLTYKSDGINDSISILEFQNDTISSNVGIFGSDKYSDFQFVDINGDNALEIFAIDNENEILDIISMDSLEISSINTIENTVELDDHDINKNLIDFDKNGTLDLIYHDNSFSQGNFLYCIYDIESIETNESIIIDSFERSIKPIFFDLDSDGTHELVLENDSQFYHYQSDGQNIISTPIKFNETFEYTTLLHLETDLDTKKQLYTIDASNTVVLAEIEVNNDTSISYNVPNGFNSSYTSEFLNASVTDVNLDGFDDILYHSNGGGIEIGVMYNNGDGSYAERQVIVDHVTFPRIAQFEDFNNDGNIDIVYYSIRNGDFVYLQNIDGEFIEVYRFDGDHDYGFYTSDFNNDGFKDLLIFQDVSGTNFDFDLQGLQNIGGEGFEFVEFDNPGINFLSNVEDFDNDGKTEFVHRSFDSGYLTITHIEDNELKTDEQTGIGPFRITRQFDLDHDGNVEFIAIKADFQSDFFNIQIYDYNSNSVKFELKTKSDDFTFTSSSQIPEEFIYFDYNDDGYDDLITYSRNFSGFSNGPISLYEYNGTTLEYRGELKNYIDFDDTLIPNTFTYLDTKNGNNRYLFVTEGDVYILNGEESTNVSFCTYLDENGNNQKDEDEQYISSSELKFTNDQNTYNYITKNSGCAVANLNEDTYHLELKPISCLTGSTNDSIDIVLDAHYDFPLVIDNEEGDIVIDITRSHSRCSFDAVYWIQVFNNTCSEFSGTLDVFIEENSTGIETILGGELIDPNTIRYSVEQLPIGGKTQFEAQVKIPSADFLNEALADSYVLTDNDTEEQYSKSLPYTLRCAYDPNDKSLMPDRTEEYGGQYIIDEELEYLIRFENVGNDSAINIKVLDYITEELDLNTLEIVSASHSFRYTLNTRTRLLTVYFDNIYLPDNKTDEPGAHGFFKFTIKPNEGLEEFTEIDNDAQIYFDFNPPIFTNTTKSTYVSDLSLITSTYSPNEAGITIFPNPTKDLLTIRSDIGEQINTIHIFTISGEYINEIKSSDGQLNISNLRSGIYLIKVATNAQTSMHKMIKI